MLPLHTILFPTDFTQQSEGAFRLACALARDYGAGLIMVHVATEPLPFLFNTGLPAMDDCKDALREKLESIEVDDANIRVVRYVEEGHPAEEILRTAKLYGVDLIVMGTHGRHGLARLFMGSIAEHVVREAPCPVLTVRKPFTHADEAESAVMEEVAI